MTRNNSKEVNAIKKTIAVSNFQYEIAVCNEDLSGIKLSEEQWGMYMHIHCLNEAKLPKQARAYYYSWNQTFNKEID